MPAERPAATARCGICGRELGQYGCPRHPDPPEPDYEMHGVPGAWAIPIFAVAFAVFCVLVVVLRS